MLHSPGFETGLKLMFIIKAVDFKLDALRTRLFPAALRLLLAACLTCRTFVFWIRGLLVEGILAFAVRLRVRHGLNDELKLRTKPSGYSNR